jgi:hypothetical protein
MRDMEHPSGEKAQGAQGADEGEVAARGHRDQRHREERRHQQEGRCQGALARAGPRAPVAPRRRTASTTYPAKTSSARADRVHLSSHCTRTSVKPRSRTFVSTPWSAA